VSDVRATLARKRDGEALSPGEIQAFVRGYVAGDVPDYAASALLMAISVHGREEDELEAWTRAMLDSGERLDFADLGRPVADKHSTGGVGDKVSIPLAPALAAAGLSVPMISGRGLGHTGGTLDKLESIPGFRTELSTAELRRALAATGMAFGGQTASLAPADKALYALRDATGLIESIPLIASSILAKKLAEGLDALVLDVKHGSGAFLPEPERGAELARTMLRLARRFDLRAVAFQTAMDRPLGGACGHALEVRESIECLKGRGPGDLRELVTTLGGALLEELGERHGAQRIARALDDGSALSVFARVIEEQGGDPRCLEEPGRLPRAAGLAHVASPRAGYLSYRDVRAVGRAVLALGGGRLHPGDVLDPAVGIVCLREAGTRVEAGDELFLVHHRNGRGLDQARALRADPVEITGSAGLAPEVLGRVELA
jgi:pyrimidine-nucleoside phosphorylase